MEKVYQPHYPTRNSGFIIIAVSIILFMLAVAAIVLGNIGAGWLVWLRGRASSLTRAYHRKCCVADATIGFR